METPRGRDQVMAAVQAAARDLLAERGPRDVSVRDIAERAGVNHALVHRHFGSKDDLIRAVLRAESAAVAEHATSTASAEHTVAMLADHPAYWQILARTVLDAPELLDPDLPAARAFLDAVGGQTRGAAARRNAGVAGSLLLGWILFGDHLAAALGVPPGRLRSAVGETVELLVSRPEPSVSRARSASPHVPRRRSSTPRRRAR